MGHSTEHSAATRTEFIIKFQLILWHNLYHILTTIRFIVGRVFLILFSFLLELPFLGYFTVFQSHSLVRLF